MTEKGLKFDGYTYSRYYRSAPKFEYFKGITLIGRKVLWIDNLSCTEICIRLTDLAEGHVLQVYIQTKSPFPEIEVLVDPKVNLIVWIKTALIVRGEVIDRSSGSIPNDFQRRSIFILRGIWRPSDVTYLHSDAPIMRKVIHTAEVQYKTIIPGRRNIFRILVRSVFASI